MSDRAPSPDPHISDAVVAAAQSAWAALDEHDKSIDECWRGALAAAIIADREDRIDHGPPYLFRRYVDGKERAEGVRINRENNLEAAMKAAVRVCSPPKRDVTVLVLECAREASAEIERLNAAIASLQGSLAHANSCLDGYGLTHNEIMTLCEGRVGRSLPIIDRVRAVCAEAERLTKERDLAQCELENIRAELSTSETAYIAVVKLKSDFVSLRAELDDARASLSIAEQATKTALESIPIAMTAAAEREREACAKIIDDQSPHLNGAISSAICASLAAAIRNREEAKEPFSTAAMLEKAVRFEIVEGDIYVEKRGYMWAVVSCGLCLNADGEFEYEPAPSSRSGEFLSRTRFAFEDAISRAHEAAAAIRNRSEAK